MAKNTLKYAYVRIDDHIRMCMLHTSGREDRYNSTYNLTRTIVYFMDD